MALHLRPSTDPRRADRGDRRRSPSSAGHRVARTATRCGVRRAGSAHDAAAARCRPGPAQLARGARLATAACHRGRRLPPLGADGGDGAAAITGPFPDDHGAVTTRGPTIVVTAP